MDVMSMKALAIGVIGAGCVAAAGVGGFLAQRLDSGEMAETPVVAAARVADASAVTSAEEPELRAPEVVATPAEPAPKVTRPDPPVEAPTPPVRRAPPQPAPPPLPVEEPPPPPAPPIVSVPTEVPASAVPAAKLPPPPPPADKAVQFAPEPPALELIELTIEEDAVIGIRLDSSVSTEQAQLEDRVTATVTRDVIVDGRTAIPAGARLEGDVTLVEAGGRFKERARLGVRFTRLLLSEQSVMRIETATIFRDGESPSGEATSKIGASAVVGAILGGIIGGKKGATIGGAAGAAGGTAAVARGGPNNVTLEEGTPLTVRLVQPIVLLVERRQ
jgi:outer membrane biosynthesis protein TonB